jgi:hypothetical protein
MAGWPITDAVADLIASIMPLLSLFPSTEGVDDVGSIRYPSYV